MSNLDKHIKQHYQSKALSQSKVDAILTEGNEKRPTRSWRSFSPLVAAALLIIGFVFFNNYQAQNLLNQRVITEIAMNHSKQLDAEITTSDYDDLQTKLNRVDFPIYSETIPENHQLLGGRYCSIQGELAAQLKLKHKKTGDVKTLYVTRLTPTLKNVKNQTITQNSITTQLWKTSDCLFALASKTPTETTY
ncbi:MAG: hypothetical protein HOE48_13560 [Candidatus Latescibacteria bacterium]|jgi:hypothetical protein|nr:hypothetical protein [Candidatus Latescibacterota bacterium]MBT4138941.1 hypothetical protein [Candidatus Latescibacterota bacterium]MBT5828730.1 hypothetical protein [Candidatus Latescibacterota bacterium]